MAATVWDATPEEILQRKMTDFWYPEDLHDLHQSSAGPSVEPEMAFQAVNPPLRTDTDLKPASRNFSATFSFASAMGFVVCVSDIRVVS